MGNPYAPPGENPPPARQPEHGTRPDDDRGPRGHEGGPAHEGGSAHGSGPVHEGGPVHGWPGPQLPEGHGLPLGGPLGGPPQGGPQHGGPQHGGPQAPSGNRRPPQPAPDSPIARATSRRVLHFLLLLLAVVITSGLPLPWQLGSFALLVAAIVVGIRAIVLAWRGGIRGGPVIMLGVGVSAAGLVGLAMLSLLALWPQQMERQECLARAVTLSATRACEADFQRSIDEILGGTTTRDTSRP